MRILFAGDEHPYSAYALKEVVRLAMNTWADVTLLGVLPELPPGEEGESPPLAPYSSPASSPTALPGGFPGELEKRNPLMPPRNASLNGCP